MYRSCVPKNDRQHRKRVQYQVSQQTKVEDVAGASNLSLDWTSPGYSDIVWDPASPVDPAVVGCAAGNLGSWGTRPGYWGSNPHDDYLVRQSFYLPKAASYQGLLTIGIDTYWYGPDRTANLIYVNGHLVDAFGHEGFVTDEISKFLGSGKNVLAFHAFPAFDSSTSVNGQSTLCSAFTFDMKVAAIGMTTAPPPTMHKVLSSSGSVTVSVPSQNAVVAGTTIPFAWHGYPLAACYYLQVWLVQPATSLPLSEAAVTDPSKRVTGQSYDLDASRMPRGVYQWRIVAVNTAGKVISSWGHIRQFTLQ